MASTAARLAELQEPFVSVLITVSAIEEAGQGVVVDGAPPLYQNFAALHSGLVKLHGVAGQFTDVVPSLLVSHVDEGGNPDELLARLAVAASQANQDTQGRLLAVAALRDALLEEAARWQSDAKAT